MPIKNTEYSTGIYRTIKSTLDWERGNILTAKLGPTKRDLRDLQKILSPTGFDIHAHLDGLEAGAKRIIKENGGIPGHRRNERGGGEWFPLPSDARIVSGRARELYTRYGDGPIPSRHRFLIERYRQCLILERARNLIFEAWSLRDGLKKLERGDSELRIRVEEIAFEAYRLGRHAEMVRVSPFEPAAKTGAAVLRGVAKGGRERRELYADKYAALQAAFDKLAKVNPHRSRTHICNLVGREKGCSGSHVRNHTKDPRKKQEQLLHFPRVKA